MTTVNRDILRLAVPTLGALVAEPLFLLADSAMVGHLGVTPLAGLGIAGVIIQTIIGLMVFLAYATTPAVARRLGAGDEPGAVSVGIDGLWLALGLGAVLAVSGWFATPVLVAPFGASPDVTEQASVYLSISMAGLPAMLLVFAATGLLRGLQDTRTPLFVATAGFAVNIALNFVFIYLLEFGIAGAAIGTVLAQWGMAMAYLAVVMHHARRTGASLRPHREGISGSALSGGWLFVRTVSLRVAILLAAFVATGLGTTELAGFQIVMTIFTFTAFALDALAIAAQALIGKSLGAADTTLVRSILARCLQWGVGAGLVLGLIVIATSGVAGLLFTGDPELARFLMPSLVVLGISTPLAGFVFVLDGVLIGAGDARYLALTGILNVAVFVPLALWVLVAAPSDATGLALLTAAFTLGYLAARATTLGLRARTTAWMRTGA
ncbi:MATE family efflux transporter [Mycetocola miduiensis]|uniref:Putative efflux protein, MATE family n=1 Tax=Mycetocola miduiensis TaxID=995034 RepID=A0A1I4YTS7_9MICO|nr:MATE family efflux transporter [Mycetocola miduiensis]SFN41448.1 putative efflux protein, MATE family [Mycetocola miduiensis]